MLADGQPHPTTVQRNCNSRMRNSNRSCARAHWRYTIDRSDENVYAAILLACTQLPAWPGKMPRIMIKGGIWKNTEVTEPLFMTSRSLNGWFLFVCRMKYWRQLLWSMARISGLGLPLYCTRSQPNSVKHAGMSGLTRVLRRCTMCYKGGGARGRAYILSLSLCLSLSLSLLFLPRSLVSFYSYPRLNGVGRKKRSYFTLPS